MIKKHATKIEKSKTKKQKTNIKNTIRFVGTFVGNIINYIFSMYNKNKHLLRI